jgi:regulator of replication initiation timing
VVCFIKLIDALLLYENEPFFIKIKTKKYSNIFRWQQRMLETVDKEREEREKLVHEFLTKEKEWAESKRALEAQICSLKAELREHLEGSHAKGKRSRQLTEAQVNLTKVQAEVDSLKSVLDMRTDEIRNLRQENARLEDRVEESEKAAAELKKVSALVEDLKAQIASKNNLERKLSAENRKLSSVAEREATEKKRLSLENEELQWRIRQGSMDALTSSVAVAEGSTRCDSAGGVSDGDYSFRVTEGFASKSLPPLLNTCVSDGENLVGSRITDPEFIPDSDVTSTEDHCPPRVSHVVEKEESVSWQLEYEERLRRNGSTPFTSSPCPRRKTSSSWTSPIVTRRLNTTPPGSPGPKYRASGQLARKPSFEPVAEEDLLSQISSPSPNPQAKEEQEGSAAQTSNHL